MLVEVDARLGPLEVEAGGDLPASLIDGVPDLLHVDLRHDIETGHGGYATWPWVGVRVAKGGGL